MAHVCDAGSSAGFGEAGSAMPRDITGEAADPIGLAPVDEVEITILVDNSYDGLLPDAAMARRTGLRDSPAVTAPGFEGGASFAGLVAEHGFSALMTVTRGGRSHTLLFDTGISAGGLATNIERLGIDAGSFESVVLSHGHFDHTGGLTGLARLRGRSGLPLIVHPLVWSRRRIVVPATPAAPAWERPSISSTALEAEGFQIVERRWPSLLLDGCVLVTGEVDRTTDFEHGMPNHEVLGDNGWEPDPQVFDDQAVVVNVRGRGLVVVTGCGHAGAVNIARHAMRLTGVDRLDALIGGFHLSGPAFAPVIEPTAAALADMAPSLVVPAHCTGWQAQQRLASRLADGVFVLNAVGTVYTITAAG